MVQPWSLTRKMELLLTAELAMIMQMQMPMYIPSIVTSMLVLFVLIYFVKLEERFTGLRETKAYTMIVEDKPGQVGRIGSALGELEVLIKNIHLTRADEEGRLEVEILVNLPPHVDAEEVIERLSVVEGVFAVERID